MSASLASDLAGAAERLLSAARNMERHLIAHGHPGDPIDHRTEEERHDAQGNLRTQGQGGGTPHLDDVKAALDEATTAHDALRASLEGEVPEADPPPVPEA